MLAGRVLVEIIDVVCVVTDPGTLLVDVMVLPGREDVTVLPGLVVVETAVVVETLVLVLTPDIVRVLKDVAVEIDPGTEVVRVVREDTV